MPYSIQVFLGPGLRGEQTGCAITLILKGESGRVAKATLTGPSGVVQTQLMTMAPSIGNVVEGALAVDGARPCDTPFACETISVSDGHRFWTLDCFGILWRKSDLMPLTLGGSRPYRFSLSMDGDLRGVGGGSPHDRGGSGPIVGVQIRGTDGSMTKPLTLIAKSGRNPGSSPVLQTVLRGADVGAIESVNLTNFVANSPWRFRKMDVLTDDGNVASFEGGLFIGLPYERSMSFPNLLARNPDGEGEGGGGGATAVPIGLECHQRLADIVGGASTPTQSVIKVTCPANCANAASIGLVSGLGTHPASTSVCLAALADGVMSNSGGTLGLTIRETKNRQFLPSLRNVTNIPIFPYRADTAEDADKFLFMPFLLESIDDVDSVVRVVDAFGRLSNVGRLELRGPDNVWGAVCAQGATESFNAEAAKVACREIGYMFGELASGDGGCSGVDGLNYCAGTGVPVITGAIHCRGNEDRLGDCIYYKHESLSACVKHDLDVVVRCTNHPVNAQLPLGTARIVDTGGGPALSGAGRLELYIGPGIVGLGGGGKGGGKGSGGEGWSTVCDDGWTRRSAAVACRSMGYDAVLKHGEPCSGFLGSNYCGDVDAPLAVSMVECEGHEEMLRDCTMEIKEDVYCVHSEDVVLQCQGANGDPSGIGLFQLDDGPRLKRLPLRSLKELRCEDTGRSAVAHLEPPPRPGTSILVTCPQGCEKTSGTASLIGTDVYNPASSVCLAAHHSQLPAPAPFLLVHTHGQVAFTGSTRAGLTSADSSAPTTSAFYLTPSTPELTALLPPPPNLAATSMLGTGRFGYACASKLPQSFLLDRERSLALSSTTNSNTDIGSGAQGGGGNAGVPPGRGALAFYEVVSERSLFTEGLVDPTVAFCNELLPHPITFRGGPDDEVNLSDLPGGQNLPHLESFSILVRLKPSSDPSSAGSWRALVSYSECEGFAFLIDKHGELVFEQECSKYVLYSGIYAKPDVWMTVTVSVDVGRGIVAFAREKEFVEVTALTFPIVWFESMKAGKSATLSYEPFVGEMSHIFIFDQPLYLEEDAFSQRLSAVVDNLGTICARRQPLEPAPVYSDQSYHLCATPCRSESDKRARLLGYRSARDESHAQPVDLDCQASLDNTPAFDGPVGAVFEIACPQTCPVHSAIAMRYNEVFPSRVPICPALLSSEQFRYFLGPNKRAKLQIGPGLQDYVREDSQPQTFPTADLRSFTILGSVNVNAIDCNDNAAVLAHTHRTGTQLYFECPKNCAQTSSGPATKSHDTNGNGFYHAQEPICSAAVREGLLGEGRGTVLLEIASVPAGPSPPELPEDDSPDEPNRDLYSIKPSLVEWQPPYLEFLKINPHRAPPHARSVAFEDRGYRLLSHPGSLDCRPRLLDSMRPSPSSHLVRHSAPRESTLSHHSDADDAAWRLREDPIFCFSSADGSFLPLQHLFTPLFDFKCDRMDLNAHFEVPEERGTLLLRFNPALYATIDLDDQTCRLNTRLDGRKAPKLISVLTPLDYGASNKSRRKPVVITGSLTSSNVDLSAVFENKRGSEKRVICQEENEPRAPSTERDSVASERSKAQDASIFGLDILNCAIRPAERSSDSVLMRRTSLLAWRPAKDRHPREESEDMKTLMVGTTSDNVTGL